MTAPVSPGTHTISVVATYKGYGHGVLDYLNKYSYTVRGSHTFTIDEGKAIRVEGVTYEKGGPSTKMEERPAIEFKHAFVVEEETKSAPVKKDSKVTPPTPPAKAAATPGTTGK